MTVSMVQFAYTPETVAKLAKNPEDRSKAVGALLEKLGGRLVAYYYTFGEYDGFVIAEMPDQVSGLAASIVSYLGGGVTKLKTTVLIPVDEAMQAMKKAQSLTLTQPKG